MKRAACVYIRRGAWVGSDEFAHQIQFFNQVEKLMCAAQAVRPALDQEAFGILAVDRAAHAVAALDEQNFAAGSFQAVSGHEAGDACPDNNGVKGHFRRETEARSSSWSSPLALNASCESRQCS